MKVLAFGSFDILHPGHRFFLECAKKKGDHLTVVIGLDSTIKNIKGRSPRFNEKIRLKQIQDLPYVDKAILGNAGDKYKVIEDVKPDIICLGYDQNHFTQSLKDELRKRDLDIEVIRLNPYKEHIFKSSKLRKT